MSWMCYYKDKGKWVSFSEHGNKQANAHLHAHPGHHEFSINHHWTSPHSGKWKTTVYAIDVRGKHQTNTEDGGWKTQRTIKLVWSEDPSLELDLATWAPVGPSSAAAAPPDFGGKLPLVFLNLVRRFENHIDTRSTVSSCKQLCSLINVSI